MRYGLIEWEGTGEHLVLLPGETRWIGGGDPQQVDLRIGLLGEGRVEARFDGHALELSGSGCLLRREDGSPASRLVLETGDRFRIGDLRFRFTADDLERSVRSLWLPDLVEIPTILHSAESGAPFASCHMCDRPLLQEPVPYFIHKVTNRREVVFEFALCMRCAAKLVSEYSIESRRRFQTYLREELLPRPSTTEMCRVCRRPVDQCPELHISGHCLGPNHIPDTLQLICFDCAEAMNRLASRQTRDRYQEFMDTCFPGVPEGIDQLEPVWF